MNNKKLIFPLIITVSISLTLGIFSCRNTEKNKVGNTNHSDSSKEEVNLEKEKK